MTLYRPHRGSLAEAMKEVMEVTSLQGIREYYIKRGFSVEEPLTCKWYAFDKRINWDTWIVCENGKALGFSNGPLE